MTARGFAVLAALLPFAAAGAVWGAEESGPREEKEAAGRAGEADISAKDQGPTIDASELSKPPKLLRAAKVVYPEDAKGELTEDVRITLLVDLDDKGQVKGAVEEVKQAVKDAVK